MKAAEFLRLAEELASHSGEAELRSAVSRAYYSAFHEARLLLDRCGIQLPASAEAHVKVAYCLQRSTNPSIAKAATALTNLRNLRNEADYRLTSTRFDPPFVSLQVASSQKVAAIFNSAMPSAVGIGVREYARDVLRLRISN